MKPIKNRIYCAQCLRPKMLFESKVKAQNFIKFNADEIMEETGLAPIRAYYCSACCGWHVTSQYRSEDLSTVVYNLTQKEYDLIKEKRFVEAARIQNYIEEKVTEYQKKFFLSAHDEKAIESVKKARSRLHASYNKYNKEMCQDYRRKSRFSIYDLNLNTQEIEVVSSSLNIEQGGIEYKVRPFLLYKSEGKFVYAIIRKKLTPYDKRLLAEYNDLKEDESFQSYSRHSLNIVGVSRDESISHEWQYDNLNRFFQSNVLVSRIKGAYLRVFVKNEYFTKQKYHSVHHYDFWIRFGDRNVRFFTGHGNNYICLVTGQELDESRTITVFKKLPATKLEEAQQEFENNELHHLQR